MARGIKRVTVNGIAMDLTGDPTSSTRKTKADDISVTCGSPDVKLSPSMPYIEFECFVPAGYRKSDFQGKIASVQAYTYDGRTEYWRNAREVATGDDSMAEGKMTLRYVSNDAGELKV